MVFLEGSEILMEPMRSQRMMKYTLKLSLLALVLVLSACGGGGGTNTADNSQTERIINGTSVSSAEAPQFIEIGIIDKAGNGYTCSGTAIDGDSILSAGHCFKLAVASVAVRAGDRVIPVKSVTVHPGYNEQSTAIFNDVAVLKTAGVHGIPPLGILKSAPVTAGSTIGIWGFGVDENGVLGSLKEGSMTLSDVTPNHLIASFNGGQNTCNGDSGGPATETLLDAAGNVTAVGVVGVTSTGSLVDCGKGDTSLFTNLQNDEILNFILSVAPGTTIL